MDNIEKLAKAAHIEWYKTYAGKPWSKLRPETQQSAMVMSDAILSAIRADVTAYVKPKPLEWELTVHEKDNPPPYVKGNTWGASFAGTLYRVATFEGDDNFHLIINQTGKGKFPTLEAAQAAAETHRNEMLAKEFV